MELLDIRFMTKRIQQATSVEELVMLRNRGHELFHLHLSFPLFTQLHEQLNEMHDQLITRAVQFAELEMKRLSGSQPTQYAFILFGSGGRHEQTLWSDQDNALIYDDQAGQDTAYYEQFSELIYQHLTSLGYAPCEGKVLSNNEKWRGNLNDWAVLLNGWLNDPNWEHVRYMIMFTDARCIYGYAPFLEQFKSSMMSYLRLNPEYLTYMLRNTLYRKVSMGFLGQLITESYGKDAGGVDIKYGVYIPMVNGIRLLANQQGLHVTSSIERIQQLQMRQVISDQQAADWLHTFERVLYMRAQASFCFEEGVYLSKGIVPPILLTTSFKKEIKQCIQIGQDIQKFIKSTIQN